MKGRRFARDSGANGEPGIANGDASVGSASVMGGYMASAFVTPSGQNGGISTAAASFDADFLTRPAA